MIEEEWRDTDYDGYEVSCLGNVRSFRNGKVRVLKGSIRAGYKRIDIKINGKRLHISIHSLVAKTFLGEKPEGLVIDHIDRNKQNNNVNNLRYVTTSENSINRSCYRTDILEQDPIKRLKIMNDEYKIKSGHNKQITRKKGTGSVGKKKYGYEAEIMINKIRYSKRCKTIEECELYLREIIEKSQKL